MLLITFLVSLLAVAGCVVLCGAVAVFLLDMDKRRRHSRSVVKPTDQLAPPLPAEQSSAPRKTGARRRAMSRKPGRELGPSPTSRGEPRNE